MEPLICFPLLLVISFVQQIYGYINKIIKYRFILIKDVYEKGLELPELIQQKELIQSRDWNCLIVLDACRYDYFEEVYSKYLEGDLMKVKSEGHRTSEWLTKTFGGNFDDTVYISANPYINSYGGNTKAQSVWGFNADDHFYKVVDLWDTHWNVEQGTVLPEDVGKATRMKRAKYPSKRIISHFLQPHTPFLTMERERNGIPSLLNQARGDEKFGTINVLRNYLGRIVKSVIGSSRTRKLRKKLGLRSPGEHEKIVKKYGRDYLIRAYKENIEICLKEIEKTVKRIPDKKIVVTSDHGELLGEGEEYGHENMDEPLLQEVPWLIVDS